MTLVEWSRRTGRWPAAAGVRTAPAGRPVPLRTLLPEAWLAVWAAGRAVLWAPAGLSGWQGTGAPRATAAPAPDDVALLWPGPRGVRAFSHRALWAAVEDTAALGAAGRGLPGPAGLVQGWASWLEGRPFGAGRFLYPHPALAWRVTDGHEIWAWDPDLLGVWARLPADGALQCGPGVWCDGRAGRVRSARLMDGWWRDGDVEPLRAEPGGWHRPAGAAGEPTGEAGDHGDSDGERGGRVQGAGGRG
jgi:hypothetical protein